MLYAILSPRIQFYIFALVFAIFYAVYPLVIFYGVNANPYLWQLALLSSTSLLFMCIAYFGAANLFTLKPIKLWTIKINTFILLIFIVFLIFLILVVTTAKTIPLLDAFKGYSVIELADSRANFLKARIGYERILLYLNGILTTSFVPYAILLSFVHESRYKWFLLFIPYAFSFLFLEKAFFLKFILPFVSLCALYHKKKNYKIYFWIGVISIPIVIYINTVLSGFGGNTQLIKRTGIDQETACSNFYSANFAECANNGRFSFIAWRLLSVPIFTATDSVKLFDTKYKHQYLMGKTSLILSLLTHQQKIHFEREVFNSEWGADKSGTASANAVYVIEQFVNFGWIGIICSSLLIGCIYRFFACTKDDALSALAIIFSLSIFFGGLISTLLSEGYLLLLCCLYFIRIKEA